MMLKSLVLYSIFALFILLAGVFVLTQNAKPISAAEIKGPVVIELFTSQSCSSCPPADAIFEKLSKEQNVIALSCHVSYWNRLNWKDTLSHEFCDIRQHGYASLTSQKRVYTPQMIVNGINGFVGSRSGDVQKALTKAKKQTVNMIEIERKEEILQFALPQIDQEFGEDFRLWMYGIRKSHQQKIESGENRGRNVHYVNSAITYDNLGAWKGNAVSKGVRIPESDIDGVIILAQSGGYGRIVAAGILDLD